MNVLCNHQCFLLLGRKLHFDLELLFCSYEVSDLTYSTHRSKWHYICLHYWDVYSTSVLAKLLLLLLEWSAWSCVGSAASYAQCLQKTAVSAKNLFVFWNQYKAHLEIF